MERARWKRPLIVVLKAAVAVLVLWAVGRHVVRTWNDLRQQEAAFQVQPVRLIASGVLYLAGLSCCGRFYERVLQASPTPIGLGPALRAYLVSHLGKYVPGKAMVVVMRAGMSMPYGARGATAAIATFYETLVMMAAGSLLAALGFAMAGRIARTRGRSADSGASGGGTLSPGGRLEPGPGAGVPGGGASPGLSPARVVGQPAVSPGGRRGLAPVFGRAHARGLSLDGGGLGASGREPDGGGLRASSPGREPVSGPPSGGHGQRGAGDRGGVRRRGLARRAGGA